jgi:hypothetical protein
MFFQSPGGVPPGQAVDMCINAVYRDEAHGGMNISSACIFQSCGVFVGVFVNLYAEKALHQQHYNIFDSCLQNKVNYK